MSSTVYLRLKKRAILPTGHSLRLGDLAQWSADPKLDMQLQQIEFPRLEKQHGLILIDILSIIDRLKLYIPDIAVETFGNPHVIVEVAQNRSRYSVIIFIIVWLLLFCGSGLAIMNFHEDVSMPAVHQRIVFLLTGKSIEHPYFLQIPYSLGIGLGMVIFFNHVFKKRMNDEPSPLEVEMFKYEESVNQYVIAQYYRQIDHNKSAKP